LKVLLVNLLAALNFANVFINKKRLENKKTLKTLKNVNKIKNVKKRFYIYGWKLTAECRSETSLKVDPQMTKQLTSRDSGSFRAGPAGGGVHGGLLWER